MAEYPTFVKENHFSKQFIMCDNTASNKPFVFEVYPEGAMMNFALQ